VSSQALTLLNSQYLIQQAEVFAARIATEKPADVGSHAVLLALGRPATEQERARLSVFLQNQSGRHLAALTAGKPATQDQQEKARQLALADLCHMLLCADEFAYVD
jgi:hypothetical protein